MLSLDPPVLSLDSPELPLALLAVAIASPVLPPALLEGLLVLLLDPLEALLVLPPALLAVELDSPELPPAQLEALLVLFLAPLEVELDPRIFLSNGQFYARHFAHVLLEASVLAGPSPRLFQTRFSFFSRPIPSPVKPVMNSDRQTTSF